MLMLEGRTNRLVLVLCNIAGMVDLVALPLWVGVLIQSRGLGPQAAGLTVTCYIFGVFTSSMVLAPRFNRLSARAVAAFGYAVGAAAFAALMVVTDPVATGALHLLAGLGAGCGLSVTHGTIARSANPHRLFAMAGLGVGLFAVAFFGFAPVVIAANGAAGLFAILGGLLALACVTSLAAFPAAPAPGPALATARLSGKLALAFAGVACFAVTQSMIFGFVDRIGAARGFSPDQVGLMLLAGGLVNVSAPILASLLQRRLRAQDVAVSAILIHGLLGASVTMLTGYIPWAACAILFVWTILFGHTFMFGLIARLDPTGRTAASTPAMLMVGAAIGPTLGGTLLQAYGIPSLGVAALAVASAGTLCFLAVRRRSAVVPDAVAA